MAWRSDPAPKSSLPRFARAGPVNYRSQRTRPDSGRSAMTQPRLPGVGRGAVPRGRNQRAVDKLAGRLRELDASDEHTAALVTLARTCAASLDRLEHDTDRSEHTIATLGRVQLEVLRELRPPVTGHDPFDELTAALSAAVRDTAPP